MRLLPGVERALGHAQHATQQNDRVMRLLLRDEPIAAHRVVVLVKKAMAFASTSRSSRTTRSSRRIRESSSRSVVVNPSRSPLSISAWASQRWTLLSAKPMSRQISAIDLPEWRINATVSDLNSLVNLRLERLSIQADSIGASIPRFQVSVEAGQHHQRRDDHPVVVRTVPDRFHRQQLQQLADAPSQMDQPLLRALPQHHFAIETLLEFLALVRVHRPEGSPCPTRHSPA